MFTIFLSVVPIYKKITRPTNIDKTEAKVAEATTVLNENTLEVTPMNITTNLKNLLFQKE